MKEIIFLMLVLPLGLYAQPSQCNKKMKFLALGDSYTIGQSVDENERWPTQFIDSLRSHGFVCPAPKIIAATGWRTDDLKQAILAANLSNDYDLVSLLIGVNNYFQGQSVNHYSPQFEELLKIAIKCASGNRSHVVVVSIPDYGFTPYGKSSQTIISKGIDDFNNANKAIALKFGVLYVDITNISRLGLKEPQLIAADGLHPSARMYSKWVSKIIDELIIIDH